MPPIDSARWTLTLEDEAQTWRLTSDWRTGERSVELGAKS
jgi:hypothetical protein